MKDRRLVSNLYLVNAALLITHEIDSAFWKEWTLFHVPGGIQLFLVLNLILVFIVLYGFTEVLRGTGRAKLFSLLLAGGGVFAFCAHLFFIALGHPEFTLPASLILLGAIFIVSVIQAVVVLRTIPAAGEVRQ